MLISSVDNKIVLSVANPIDHYSIQFARRCQTWQSLKLSFILWTKEGDFKGSSVRSRFIRLSSLEPIIVSYLLPYPQHLEQCHTTIAKSLLNKRVDNIIKIYFFFLFLT